MDRPEKITFDCSCGSGAGQDISLLSRGKIGADICSNLERVKHVVLGEGLVFIEPCSFANCFVETVAIPKSVKAIGRRAFYRSVALRRIEFAEDCELEVIGEESFRESGLEQVTMPLSVREICAGAFSSCRALERVRLNEGLKVLGTDVGNSGSERGVFEDSGVRSVELPSTLLEIKDRAFANCPGLTQINLPTRLEIIGRHALRGTGIEAFTVPPSLKEIGQLMLCASAEPRLVRRNDSVQGLGTFCLKDDAGR